MTKQQLLNEAKALPPEELVDLTSQLCEAVDELPMTQELREELDRRIADDDSDPTPAEDWATLREKLLRREI